MAPSVTNTTTLPAAQFLRETSLRRQLRAELATIQTKIQEFGDDSLSNSIQEWRDNFYTSLNSHRDEELVLTEYKRLLQQILVDSITQTPLDDKPLLGSDGNTYGSKSLCIYLHRFPNVNRNRSPLEPNNENRFITAPHKVAEHMIQWLERYDARIESEEVNRLFNELPPEEIRYIIPNQINNRMYRIMQRQQRRVRTNNAFTQTQRDLRERNIEQIENLFRPLQEQTEAFDVEANESLDTIERRDVQARERLQERADQLDNEITNHENEITRLRERLENLNTQISEAERQDIQLKIAIAETEKAIKKRKKRRILKAIAVIAICIIVNCMIPGSGLSFASTAEGGAQATYTYYPKFINP